jgi:tetratricopeptide (TPR) repeat protein
MIWVAAGVCVAAEADAPTPGRPPSGIPERHTPRPIPPDIDRQIEELVRQSDVAWHRGDYPECVRINEDIIKLDPTWVDMYSTTAWLQWSMGQDIRALRTLHQGIAANPKSWEARFDMGLHRFNIKEYAKAEKYLCQAVALGGDKEARKMYAYALAKDGKAAEALPVWRALHRDFPTDGVVLMHWQRAEQEARVGQQPK